MRQPIKWALGTSAGRSQASSNAVLKNLFAEPVGEDGKAPYVVYGTPGTLRFCPVDGERVHALPKLKARQFVVTNTHFSEIDADGNVTPLGDIDIRNHVSWAENGVHVVFVDGRKGYYYSEATGLQELSGDGWYPSNSVTFQDNYFIFNRTDTGQFFISRLISVEFDPLDFATAEGAPDDTLAVLSDHRQLWVFGEQSVEFWYNSGDVDFPFARMQGAFIERGILAPATAAKINNVVLWLGDDGKVYLGNSANPQRVSNHALEYHVGRADATDANAYTYTDEGHVFYVLNLPKVNQTWCYDLTTGLWHRRSHVNYGMHNASCYSRAFDRHLLGDAFGGQVLESHLDYYTDGNQQIQRVAESIQFHVNRDRLSCHSVELDMETGHGKAKDEKGQDPQAMLQWSDDGGESWSNEYFAPLGKIGEYLSRVIWRRLGQFRQRTFKVTITEPVKVVILGAFVEVTRDRH